MKSKYLSHLSQFTNHRTLTRLNQVMIDHGLKRIQVADLLGVSRSLVTRWFAQQKRCPENYPELLRATLDIRSRSSIKDELDMKRMERSDK